MAVGRASWVIPALMIAAVCWSYPRHSALASAIAVGLNTPSGATVTFDQGAWVVGTYSDIGGDSNDLGDGGFLGGDYLRTNAGAPATLTLNLSNVPAHTHVSIGLHVAQLESLDPVRDGDLFSMSFDGSPFLGVGLGFGSGQGFFDPVVSNFTLNGVTADTALVDAVRTLTIDKGFDDHVYNFGELDAFQGIPHSSDTLTLQIVGIGGQGFPNEAYAIDNLFVIIPEPAGMAFGLASLVLAVLRLCRTDSSIPESGRG